jgi:hypothetical protein
MPRRKKRPVELPTDEALKKMFPKAVRDEIKKTAKESEKKTTRRQSR